MKLKANCKINLGLDVLRRREDGYHDLSTVMYPVRGLYDELEITPAESDGAEFVAAGMAVDCPPEQNICVKAHRLMRARYGVGGVRIVLDKRVPFGAELGSDTAFFVRNTPQLCEGRGEIMTPAVVDLDGMTIAIVKPAASVSTREAYSGVRPSLPARPLSERIAEPVAKWQGSVKNDFEESVFALYPEIGEVKRALLDAGAVYASMSGSGSAVFGLFDDPAAAEKMRTVTPYIFGM